MPQISNFYGILVYMYYNDHAPPHFHAKYGGKEVIINIDTLSVLMGKIQPRALGMVIEWATLHQDALKTNWEKAGRKEPLDPIPPLS